LSKNCAVSRDASEPDVHHTACTYRFLPKVRIAWAPSSLWKTQATQIARCAQALAGLFNRQDGSLSADVVTAVDRDIGPGHVSRAFARGEVLWLHEQDVVQRHGHSGRDPARILLRHIRRVSWAYLIDNEQRFLHEAWRMSA